MRTRWEYRIAEITISDKWSTKQQAAELARFVQSLNDIGAEGWELVKYDAIPLTGSISATSINGYAYVAIFKRPSDKPLAPANTTEPGWHADPYGRHQMRYWDIHDWTRHVSDDGQTSEDDPPDLHPETEADRSPGTGP